jgi:lysophospholipase L1-like esterase
MVTSRGDGPPPSSQPAARSARVRARVSLRNDTRLWLISACSLCAILLVLSFPAVSRAGCGGTVTAAPKTHVRGQLAPLAIGDSTMLLSLPGLAAKGYEANAHGCRQFYQAVALLGQLRAGNALPHMVVISLGANCCITPQNITAALQVLGPGRLLVLVTPRQLGGGSGANAALEHQEARDHPGRILLLDWVNYSAGHPGWFQPDGLHLTFPGVHAFTALLAEAVPYAYQPCPPRALGHVRRAVAAPRLELRTSLSHIGYVAVRINGPAGARVQLSQRTAGGLAPVRAITLSAAGTATMPRALIWLCNPRARALVATTLLPALPATAATTVATPPCSKRLVVEIPSHARIGRTIVVRLRDRWTLGGFPLTICVAPPGARRDCARERLHPGRPRRSVVIPVPRPGGWRVTVQTRYRFRHSTLVWVSHRGRRIRLLAAGDSEMQILDTFVAQDLSSHRVDVTSDARISTGLTNSSFFSWPNHARQQAPSLRPDVTVIFMGANDGFPVAGNHGRPVGCCGPSWSAGYANLAAETMRIYLRGTAGRVYWFLLPAPRPANFQAVFNGVNKGIREAARRFPGRVGLIDANAFFTPGNRYRDYMVYHGHGLVIHESDGIHLSTASDVIDASIITRRLLADHIIR